MRTVGVEEELLVVDPRARVVVPRAQAVLARVRGDEDDVDHELFGHQVETQTDPVTDLGELADQLVDRRRRAGVAAEQIGLALAASGTAPGRVDLELTRDDRYEAMAEKYGEIGRGGGTCGMHVHVGVESDEEGIAVMDGIAPWLSLLVAVSANSPFIEGRDSGHASWRTLEWGRWPTAGPTARFGCPERYRTLCRALVEAGAARDEKMLYFDARLSQSFPTVEVRVADVTADPSDAVLVAALARGLVETEARRHAEGREPGPEPRIEQLRAGRWQAARYGTAHRLLDPRDHRPRPAAEVLQTMVEHVRAALEDAGDHDLVVDGLARVRHESGAARQRAALERGGSVDSVVDDLVERTARSWT